jgi:hypothetical protein
VTADEMAKGLQISHGSAYEIFHNTLGFHKICAGWVPKQLAMLYNQMPLDNYQQHLDRYGNECDAFLDRIHPLM